jgi:hypothetical protein
VLECVSVSQLVRFLVMELTHTCSNPRFDESVVFMANYSFSLRRRPCRRVCVYRGECSNVYEYSCILFLKNHIN